MSRICSALVGLSALAPVSAAASDAVILYDGLDSVELSAGWLDDITGGDGIVVLVETSAKGVFPGGTFRIDSVYEVWVYTGKASTSDPASYADDGWFLGTSSWDVHEGVCAPDVIAFDLYTDDGGSTFGIAEDPGDDWYPGEEWFPGDEWFPGEEWTPVPTFIGVSAKYGPVAAATADGGVYLHPKY